ncbi:MAG: hypothetical protein ACN6O6_01030 [Pseudomonas sp.]|uniref:hypothetical protein n=1 Tax=Pseudomonas sp. TaxID=306 RepID=UPI003D10CACC
MSDHTVIPFPLTPKPSNDKPPQDCPFQAQAELRWAMLRTLVRELARLQPTGNRDEQRHHAREQLREVAARYHAPLAAAGWRVRHAKAFQ